MKKKSLIVLAVLCFAVANFCIITKSNGKIDISLAGLKTVLASGSEGSGGEDDWFYYDYYGQGFSCDCAAGICLEEICNFQVIDTYTVDNNGVVTRIGHEEINLGGCHATGQAC